MLLFRENIGPSAVILPVEPTVRYPKRHEQIAEEVNAVSAEKVKKYVDKKGFLINFLF